MKDGEGAADRKVWKEKTERVTRQYFTWILDMGCRKSLKLTSVRGKEMTLYSLSWWWH